MLATTILLKKQVSLTGAGLTRQCTTKYNNIQYTRANVSRKQTVSKLRPREYKTLQLTLRTSLIAHDYRPEKRRERAARPWPPTLCTCETSSVKNN